MACNRNWLRPLFKAIHNTFELYKHNDHSYILPAATSNHSLNILSIILYTILLMTALAETIYINNYATTMLFPLYTLSIANCINIFIITLSLFALILFLSHLCVIAPYITPPSKLKYTDKSYWIVLCKSFCSKTLAMPILFSLSPLLSLCILFILFILGNSPILNFCPNIKAFHHFHLHLHNNVMPKLHQQFKGQKEQKSSQWIQRFVHMLFNCIILDEFMMKKNAPPRLESRLSFVNVMAGNDAEAVMKRVSKHLEQMIKNYDENNCCDVEANARSWNENYRQMNAHVTKARIGYNLIWILTILYPFHLCLFWLYFLCNFDRSFAFNMRNIIIIGSAQCSFYIVSS